MRQLLEPPRRRAALQADGLGDAPRRPPPAPPAPRQDERSAPVAAGALPLTRPPSLLIVDDDPLMTDLLPRRLRRVTIPQLRILTASAPDDALRVIAEEQPDIILSDFNLRAPLDGLDVLAQAATRAPRATRILFSAHTRREIGPRLETTPIDGFIEKTMRLDELIQPLLRLIRDTRGLDLAGRPDA